MKIYLLLAVIVFQLACADSESTKENDKSEISQNRISKPGWQPILDSAEISGSVLIYDLQKNVYYSNDFAWAEKAQLPASTFKIPNSIVALETGVVHSDSTLFKWDGQPRAIANWEQDLTLGKAFHYSCVPCYQEIARNIGVSRMQENLERIQYPGMQVEANNIAIFWLQGNSNISQFQQIEFLSRLHQSQLSISARTEAIIKKMMLIEEIDGYELRGKTGWSIRDSGNNGWFVGYLLRRDNPYFFATNIEPKGTFNMEEFPRIRKEITFEMLKELKLID